MTDRQLPGVHVGVPLTARCPVLASRAQGVVIGRFSAWAVRGYLLWSFSGELVGRGGTLAGNGGELDGNGGELLGLGGNETAMLLRGRLPRPARVSCAVVSAARWRAARGYPCRSPNDRVNALAALKPQERVLLRIQTLIGPAATARGNGATADVDGGLNPRLSGAALKTGTNFAANSWRPECGAMDPCQRRKPPEAVAKGQRLQGSVAR